jgi:hypothetical protein
LSENVGCCTIERNAEDDDPGREEKGDELRALYVFLTQLHERHSDR